MLYDAYEMQRSLLAGASALANFGARAAQQSGQSLRLFRRRPGRRLGARGLRPCRGAARQARIRARPYHHRRQGGRGPRGDRAAQAVRPAQAFRPRGRDRRAASSQAADRRADVGPLRDAAARHGRADAAGARRLHHRLARRQAGAARRRALRSRRLYRLSGRVPRACRARGAHARGVPAVGAGLCRGRADERRQASVPAADADDDGRSDRHPRGADRGQHARDRAAAMPGSSRTSSPPCR